MKPLNNILYMEDEPDIREVAKAAMQIIGKFNIRACDSGFAGLEAIKTFPADLILLDVMMPGLDGPATFKKLREIAEAAKIPVIFMTAKVQTHELQEYKNLGAIGVISKPFDPMKLCEDIRSLWDKYNG